MKKNKIEYLLYIFIILSPLLDAFAFLVREWFPSLVISPVMIIRFILPLFLIIYIFLKDKGERKKIFLLLLVLLIYDVLHLYIFGKNVKLIAYGGVFQECQYLLNYSYMVVLLFIVFYLHKNIGLHKLSNALFIMLCIYLGIIYFSILTKTSYSTYLEGMGYRSYFTSGNSIGTILIILYGTLIDDLKKGGVLSKVVWLLLFVYLCFLLGTRTGLFGFVLISLFYGITLFFQSLLQKNKVSFKKLIAIFGVLLALGCLFLIMGSETLKRRKHLESESNAVMDINTMDVGHTTGDTSAIVYKIRHNEIENGYISEEEANAYLKMYAYANRKEFRSTDLRRQQIVFHTYLVKEQKSLPKILMGNGYVNHYGEMILESEILAIIFNFGLLGFVFFLGPFLVCFIKKVISCKESFKKDVNKVMHVFCFVLGFLLSLMAGYVFFSTSCVLILICNLAMLGED